MRAILREYWPEVLTVQIEHSEVCAKWTRGDNSPSKDLTISGTGKTLTVILIER